MRLVMTIAALGLASCSNEPPIDVTVPELVAAYAANEAAAQASYGNRPLRVLATVDKVNLGPSDVPFVNLAGSAGLIPVQLKFAPGAEQQAATLIVGNSYQFVCGQVSEVMGTPMLGQCRLASGSTS